jgi:phage terminase large subunit-like protein
VAILKVRLLLLPWQCFIVGSIFGWKNARGFRRFRMVYVESGKDLANPLSAGIGLYCLTADKEPRAEVYAAATKKTRQWSFS